MKRLGLKRREGTEQRCFDSHECAFPRSRWDLGTFSSAIIFKLIHPWTLPKLRSRKRDLGYPHPLKSKLVFEFLSGAVLLPGLLLAQAIHAPVLHRRDEPERGPQTITEVHGAPVLPDDASGEYLLGQPGEVVEIILEQQGRLTGYISAFGNRDSDRGTPLTFLFHHTSVSGEQISFETITVHSTWYSFVGSIQRGDAKTRAEDGFYRLIGTLEEHDTAAGTVQKRNVDLKLSHSSN